MNGAGLLYLMTVVLSQSMGVNMDEAALKEMATIDLKPVRSETMLDGEVVQILDGDTIRVKTSTGVATVRLANIDAPEKDQPGGIAASSMLNMTVGARQVLVHVVTVDRYGRFVGDIELKEKRDVSINTLMACSGWAWAAEKRYLLKPAAARCEALARRAKLGIWAFRVKHVAPWRHRRGK